MAKTFADLIQPTLDKLKQTLKELAEANPKPDTTPPLTTDTLPLEPTWLTRARKEIGVKEISGLKHNLSVLQYGVDARVPDASSDEIPWCAWFVGAILEREGITGTHSALAKSYASKGWGENLPKTELRPGAIVVLNRVGGADWQGHTGFAMGENDTHVWLLGGNQANKVGVDAFPKSRIAAVKWPKGQPKVGPASVFLTAKDLKTVSDR